MSFVGRVFQAVFQRKRLVGRDLQGNRFYERPSTTDDPRRTRRTIEYHQKTDVHDYVGGSKQIPVQWSAWLRHTRAAAPSIEELTQDMHRQQVLMQNVAEINARDEEEAQRQLSTEKDLKMATQEVIADKVRAQLPQIPSTGYDDKPKPWSPTAKSRG